MHSVMLDLSNSVVAVAVSNFAPNLPYRCKLLQNSCIHQRPQTDLKMGGELKSGEGRRIGSGASPQKNVRVTPL